MIDSTFKNANILIVDDMKVNIDILAGFLEIQGYTNIQYTTDSRLVVKLFQSFKPDLILLDLMMPYFTGYDVMAQLKELIGTNEYLPILVLTADITCEAKQHALFDGAKDFLAKPFDLVEVGLRIGNLLFARYLYQQLQAQNHSLEEKVMERTMELEKINCDLIAAKEKAESSDRLKTAFLNNISHEIRTPLSGIIGMSQVLTEPELSQEEKEVYSSHLKSNSDRLITTITNYVDMALLVSGNLEIEESIFAPGLFLAELQEEFRPLSEFRHLTFILQQSGLDDDFQIKSDAGMLRKAISQLIDNAIKFTKQGEVVFGAERRENELEFFVRDTGTGIDEASHSKIFDHFTQENLNNTRGHEGSGLGLSISKKMIELLGGQIRFESVKGKGSTFYLSLPYKAII